MSDPELVHAKDAVKRKIHAKIQQEAQKKSVCMRFIASCLT